jgi:hypothetical protein
MDINKELKEIDRKQAALEQRLKSVRPLKRLLGDTSTYPQVYGSQILFSEEGDYLSFEDTQKILIELGELFNLELRIKKGK